MRNSSNVFHLAIPCKDLDETFHFYIVKLGCKLARRYNDRITIDFFGDQVVCHLSPENIDKDPQMYPRHFGVTFFEKKDYDNVLKLAKERELTFFHDEFIRFKGQVEEHLTFFLKDPSNNILEFKYYYDHRMMY
ncbi:glyoxalase [Sulfurimonas aquatica]|uniref:Glyoxalase n=1 Tax=Sulfurimonas aquatica TaxID=2672570 RepID=A0A975AZ30_9BACT|nr:VOC family protein [Sulfurimonas aquatica]QSZ41237.1 glyoxalase [Sulfurimonas aquatica]